MPPQSEKDARALCMTREKFAMLCMDDGQKAPTLGDVYMHATDGDSAGGEVTRDMGYSIVAWHIHARRRDDGNSAGGDVYGRLHSHHMTPSPVDLGRLLEGRAGRP